ncbi:MAG: zinc-binding dehydrogenase [Caldilineales bacterium]|nr:zinc-binding dehydrogenase [Caldilineales bacterium]
MIAASLSTQEVTTKFKSVVVTHRGGLDAVKIIETDLRPPAAGEVRIKVLASPVVQDDIAVRVGNRPFLQKPPFVPGYSVLGEVDALGADVSGVSVGDRVAALTNFGGHAETIYWDAAQVVQVPPTLDPAQAVVLILNYLVAYQIMNRVVQVRPGDKALIIGASGGVGTAFLDLGRLAGLTMFGLASAGKHPVIADYGAMPIDYRTQDFAKVLQEIEPQGLDFVFNGMGEEYFKRGLAVLKRGGVLVHYGGPESLSRFFLLVGKLILYNVLPNGKAIKGYGTHRGDVRQYKDDWNTLFGLLAQGRIDPLVTARFPILDATQAYALLESGRVAGNLVLMSPELFQGKSRSETE